MALQGFSGLLTRSRKALAGSVAQWFLTGKGRLLGSMEHELLQAQLARHFGSFVLFYNPPAGMIATPSIRHQVSIGDRSRF